MPMPERLCRRYISSDPNTSDPDSPAPAHLIENAYRTYRLAGGWRRCRKLIMVMEVSYGHMVYKCPESRHDSTHHPHHKHYNQTQAQAQCRSSQASKRS